MKLLCVILGLMFRYEKRRVAARQSQSRSGVEAFNPFISGLDDAELIIPQSGAPERKAKEKKGSQACMREKSEAWH